MSRTVEDVQRYIDDVLADDGDPRLQAELLEYKLRTVKALVGLKTHLPMLEV